MLIIEKVYCTGCRLCEKNCPTGAIKVIGRKARVNNGICNDCYRCIYICPNSAIRAVAGDKEKLHSSKKSDLSEISKELIDLRKKLEKIEAGLGKTKGKQIKNSRR